LVPVRRLLLVLTTLGVLGLLVYRQRTIDRWERSLGIGNKSGGTGPA
jgi:hypothetical protein